MKADESVSGRSSFIRVPGICVSVWWKSVKALPRIYAEDHGSGAETLARVELTEGGRMLYPLLSAFIRVKRLLPLFGDEWFVPRHKGVPGRFSVLIGFDPWQTDLAAEVSPRIGDDQALSPNDKAIGGEE